VTEESNRDLLKRVLDNQDDQGETLSRVRERLSAIEATMSDSRTTAVNVAKDLIAYRDSHKDDHKQIESAVSRLTTWYKGMAVAWGILVAAVAAIEVFVR